MKKSDISVLNTYIVWLTSLPLALGVGIAYYIAAMLFEYGHIRSEDFEGLVHFFVGMIVIVFSTGMLSSTGIVLIYKQSNRRDILAKNILYISSIFAFVFLLLIITPLAAFLFNTLSLLIFILIPWLAHTLTYTTKLLTPAFIIVLLLCAALVASMILGWVLVATSSPPPF